MMEVRKSRAWLLLLIPFAHELGHYIMYRMTHPLLPCWFNLSLEGISLHYLTIYTHAIPLVFAGGLLFTIPFVLFCRGWLSWSWWAGWMLYGAIEATWGLML